jgi:uncharacterized protein YozE (UPF0346 family)
MNKIRLQNATLWTFYQTKRHHDAEYSKRYSYRQKNNKFHQISTYLKDTSNFKLNTSNLNN